MLGYNGTNCEILLEEQSCPEGSKDGTCTNGKSVKALPDPCASFPCNNGTCKSTGGDSYVCICPEGITGAKCETDINECNENRTICNYGICYNTVGEYSLNLILKFLAIMLLM